MKPEHIIDFETGPPLAFRPRHTTTPHSTATQEGTPAPSLYRAGGKRLADVVLSALLLLLVGPLVALLALIIALMDGHNPFYAQERVGRGGRPYRMWKLRSMVPDADATLEACLASDPARRAEWDVHQKLQNDPRVTGFGRFLRAGSLDELPQFWNVLKGDMSVVGPRPMMVGQADLYLGKSYFTLRPGITGPWQVSDRHASTFADRARYDEAYNRTMSFGTDMAFVVRTVGVVFRGRGC
jgi:lipopolysaccharide/colanic/teichoic acid biosynthesis glycosyltransferase